MEKNLLIDHDDETEDSDQDMFSATPQRETTSFRSRTTPTTKRPTTPTTMTTTPMRKTIESPATKSKIGELTSMASPLREQNSILGRFVSSSQVSNNPLSNDTDDVHDADVSFFCVISTGLNRHKRESFSRFLSTFKIATSKVLDDGVTHVVVDATSDNCAVRTLKYIQVRIISVIYFYLEISSVQSRDEQLIVRGS